MKRLFTLLLAAIVTLSLFVGCADTKDPIVPPQLFIISGSEAIRARLGTCSLKIEYDDGTANRLEADSFHPLNDLDTVPIIPIPDNGTLVLNFEQTPSSITVKRYTLDAPDPETYDTVPTTENTVTIEIGEYVYEIQAELKGGVDTLSGTIYYAFRTQP